MTSVSYLLSCTVTEDIPTSTQLETQLRASRKVSGLTTEIILTSCQLSTRHWLEVEARSGRVSGPVFFSWVEFTNATVHRHLQLTSSPICDILSKPLLENQNSNDNTETKSRASSKAQYRTHHSALTTWLNSDCMTHVTDVHNDKILSNDNEDYESVSPAADVTDQSSPSQYLVSTTQWFSVVL